MPLVVRDALHDNIVANIKKHREASGLSQARLASKAGMSAQQISDYESGRYLPQLPQLSRIAVALEINVSDLIEGVAA